MRRIFTIAASLALLSAWPAFAQIAPPPANVFGIALGAHGVWLDGASAATVSDIEGGLNARASLSPHISLVGSGGYGFVNEYLTGAGGLRITATDVKDRTFSVGVGIQYRWYDDIAYGLREWMPDVGVGWRPWADVPNFIISGTGAYGMTSKRARATLGARFVLY